YALIGDCEGAGLVSKSGSIDWLCLPHFDSGACFSALLGTEEHGFWRICPEGEFRSTRAYVGHSMVLETIFETESGKIKLTDWMMLEDEEPLVFRIVEGLEGEVKLKLDFVV